jgi:hypothetical protein
VLTTSRWVRPTPSSPKKTTLALAGTWSRRGDRNGEMTSLVLRMLPIPVPTAKTALPHALLFLTVQNGAIVAFAREPRLACNKPRDSPFIVSQAPPQPQQSTVTCPLNFYRQRDYRYRQITVNSKIWSIRVTIAVLLANFNMLLTVLIEFGGRMRTADQYLARFWWFDWIIMPWRKVH